MEGSGNQNHQHHSGCGCAEEAKRTDAHGLDLYSYINLDEVDCFNEKVSRSIKNVLRPLSERMDFSKGVLQSGYGKDLVVFIPFDGEIKIKSIIIIGGDEGTAPSKMKLFRNVEVVDINILEEKKPLQVIDMNENVTGELEYLLNVSKFNNTSNLVLGFDENFGAASTVIKFIGFKGEKLREKIKVVETAYEIRANLADHKMPEEFQNASNLGMSFEAYKLKNIQPLLKYQQRFFKQSQCLMARQLNHYQTLGVKTNTSDKDIKLAYFKLAKKYHPDVNSGPDARDKFEKASKAYEILSDESKKETYDQQMGFGRQSQQFHDYHSSGQTAQRSSRQSGVYSDDEYENVQSDKRTKPFQGESDEKWKQDPKQGNKFWKDVDNDGKGTEKEEYARQVWDEFDEYFQFNDQNQGPASRDDTKGADYKADIEIEFMDAIKGVKQQLEMNKRMICQSCKGTKAKLGSQPRKCYECGGRGSVIGNYGIRKKCKKCNGAGCIVRVPCQECDGLGVQRQTVKEDIELPQGLQNGQKIKLKGLGHASDVYLGVAGDLLLNINVKDHPIFKREDQNTISEVTLSLTDALLGCKLTIDTVDGKINIELKPGVNEGDELVLKHKGVPLFQPPDNYDEELLRGDHIVRFKVQIPTELTQKQREILEQFKQKENENKEKYYESIKQEYINKEKQKHHHYHKHQQHQQQTNSSDSSHRQNSSNSHKQEHHHHSNQKHKQDADNSKAGGLFGKIKGIFS